MSTPNDLPTDTAQQFLQLMEELKKTRDDMQQKFETLQEFAAGQEDATERVVKKLRIDQGYTFKKKGHKHQFHFNEEIEDRLLKARAEVAKLKPTTPKEAKVLENLQQELREGTQAITLHQKHIKVSDRSDYG